MNCLSQRKKLKSKHPAWRDPNDCEPELFARAIDHEDELLESKSGSSSTSSDEDDEYDMYANDVRSKKLNLETKNLQYKHLADINNERSYKGSVQQVQFHPTSKVALVALSYGQADLFEIDGERNRYIQNIKLPRTRSPFCSFKPDGGSIVISSEHYKGTFYTYDMISASIKQYSLRVGTESKEITDFNLFGDYMACRKEGCQDIYILSSKTFEKNFSVRINEPVKAIQFTSNKEMIVAGENARIYVWDLRKMSLCKHKFQDDGTVHTTSLSLSESSKLLSIGSDSGIVNTYELDTCMSSKFPQPLKTYSNLKTQIDILTYNNTGELLLMASRAELGAFRMVHSHSGSVYKNFPVANRRYGSLFTADFSPLSGYLALGCSSGRAHLCRIPYYSAY